MTGSHAVLGTDQSTGSEGLFTPWMVATFAGWTLGFFLMLILIGVAGLLGLGETQFSVGLGMGAGVGIAQGRLVDEPGRRRLHWWSASAGGMAAPLILVDVARLLDWTVPYSLAVCVVLGGFIVGVLQFRLLKDLSASAAQWIPLTTLGWSLAGSTVIVSDRFLPKIPGLIGALLYVAIILVGGLILGAIQGVWLPRLRRPTPAGAASIGPDGRGQT